MVDPGERTQEFAEGALTMSVLAVSHFISTSPSDLDTHLILTLAGDPRTQSLYNRRVRTTQGPARLVFGGQLRRQDHFPGGPEPLGSEDDARSQRCQEPQGQ